jgi:hypothetical protein
LRASVQFNTFQFVHDVITIMGYISTTVNTSSVKLKSIVSSAIIVNRSGTYKICWSQLAASELRNQKICSIYYLVFFYKYSNIAHHKTWQHRGSHILLSKVHTKISATWWCWANSLRKVRNQHKWSNLI